MERGLPSKAVVSELQDLRAELREAGKQLCREAATRKSSVCALAVEAGNLEGGELCERQRVRDLRDMLTLLRHRPDQRRQGAEKNLKKSKVLSATWEC